MSRHASNPIQGEFTLCGRAFDDEDEEDGGLAPVFAEPGQRITCESCVAVLSHCKRFTNNCEPGSRPGRHLKATP